MQKLSVVIITYNEEQNIGHCLNSVVDVADDIVIIDAFSTDQTEKICKEFQVRFIQEKWMGYSTAKNFGNTQARFDWILSLDADEALSPELAQSILHEKHSIDSPSIYRLNRLTNYCGKWIRYGGWYPDLKVRLFDRKKSVWEGNVHEQLTNINEGSISILTGDLFHYSYHSLRDHKMKLELYSDLAAQTLWEKGKKASIIKRYLSPVAKFVNDYILKRGFMDGAAGFQIAMLSASATYKKYRKLQTQLNKK